VPALLWVVAALYFRAGASFTMEWTDQGQIVYPIWRVAEGALPYRDFLQLYGPSLFFLNGALLHLFGADLAVLRTALVAVKALVAVLVYLSARSVAPPWSALFAYVLCVAVWGAPWWVFSTPYANHFALALTLAGMLALVTLRARRVVACLLAGLCVGLAATFKQTAGLFAGVAIALFLIWDTQAVGADPPRPVPPARLDGVARAVRMAALVGAMGLLIAYLSTGGDAFNALLLLAPAAVGIGQLAVGEWRGPGDPARRMQSVAELLWLAVGLCLPPAAYALIFACHGALGALLFNTVRGLPGLVQWFTPLPPIDRRVVAWVGGVLIALLALRGWGTLTPRRQARVALAVLAVVAAAVLLTHRAGLLAFILAPAWSGDILRLFYALPFVVVWLTWPLVFWGPRTPPLAAFYFFAAVSLPLLHPAGDIWHVFMGLPAFLPLLAVQLARVPGARPGRLGTVVSAAALATLLLIACAPFAVALWQAPRVLPQGSTGFARATGVIDASPKFRDAGVVVGYLDDQPAGRPLFVLANAQMFYFLAGRPSALEPEEFVLYLVGGDLIAADAARALLSDAGLATRLAAARPLLIDEPDSVLRARFRRVYPETAAYIDAHTRPVQVAGAFTVRDWVAP